MAMRVFVLQSMEGWQGWKERSKIIASKSVCVEDVNIKSIFKFSFLAEPVQFT